MKASGDVDRRRQDARSHMALMGGLWRSHTSQGARAPLGGPRQFLSVAIRASPGSAASDSSKRASLLGAPAVAAHDRTADARAIAPVLAVGRKRVGGAQRPGHRQMASRHASPHSSSSPP
jgi:hypothetical protein